MINLFQNIRNFLDRSDPATVEGKPTKVKENKITIVEKLLTVNKWSRPGLERDGIKGIEVHWVENPKSSAKLNWNWFEARKGGKNSFGSTQYIIDQDGTIIRMIPDNEIAYSSGAKTYRDGVSKIFGKKSPYWNTLSIECTHVDWNGKMTPETYKGLVDLCVHLCKKYELSGKDLYLHYELTGKLCHKWFVDNPKEWGKFKDLVDSKL